MSRHWVTFILVLLLTFGIISSAKSEDHGPNSAIDANSEVTFSTFKDLTLSLVWSNNYRTSVKLRDENDCIFSGQFREDLDSIVQVTGCEGEDFDVLIQSEVLGDSIFNTKEGFPVYVEFTEDELYNEYGDHDSETYGRRKRNADDDYDYTDYTDVNNGVPNENIDIEFPQLNVAGAEIEDIEMPAQLILNLNIYLDQSWKALHKEDRYKTAKQVMSKVALLYKHSSLVTKIDVIHNDRIYDSGENMTTRDLKKILTKLRYPWKVDGKLNHDREFNTAHVYFTTEGRGLMGVAELESICDTVKKSVAVVKWKSSTSRTSMTTAHEIGHILGMYHDFAPTKSGRLETCAIKDQGEYMLNYGKQRGKWSACSNEDFKAYYERVVLNSPTGFCLENPFVSGTTRRTTTINGSIFKRIFEMCNRRCSFVCTPCCLRDCKGVCNIVPTCWGK